MKNVAAVKWGLVTFLLGITAGTLGHYLPVEASVVLIPMLSAIYAAIGAAAQAE